MPVMLLQYVFWGQMTGETLAGSLVLHCGSVPSLASPALSSPPLCCALSPHTQWLQWNVMTVCWTKPYIHILVFHVPLHFGSLVTAGQRTRLGGHSQSTLTLTLTLVPPYTHPCTRSSLSHLASLPPLSFNFFPFHLCSLTSPIFRLIQL